MRPSSTVRKKRRADGATAMVRPLRPAWVGVLCLTAACTPPPAHTEDSVVHYRAEVVRTYSHDPSAYTQGLTFDNGLLYEGTGLYGRSTLRRIDLEAKSMESRPLPAKYFGEGIAVVDERIFQLTWKSRTGFVYRKSTLEPIDRFRYPTEGWGLTYDGRHLIMSDGSDRLYRIDPDSYEIVGQLPVRHKGTPVRYLNELEYIDGEIFANVWGADYIVRISPADGGVTGRIDLAGLYPRDQRPDEAAVLNGIAFDKKHGRLLVTGKLWPQLFEIQLVPVER